MKNEQFRTIKNMTKQTSQSFQNCKMFFAPNEGWGKVGGIWQIWFKCALFPSLCPSLKVGLAGLLRKEVKQYSVLYNKEMKEYREKDRTY